ncbi:MAG: hypothetical protein QXH27_03820 [Candidatus Micrarchaeia archaeon]
MRKPVPAEKTTPPTVRQFQKRLEEMRTRVLVPPRFGNLEHAKEIINEAIREGDLKSSREKAERLITKSKVKFSEEETAFIRSFVLYHHSFPEG